MASLQGYNGVDCVSRVVNVSWRDRGVMKYHIIPLDWTSARHPVTSFLISGEYLSN